MKKQLLFLFVALQVFASCGNKQSHMQGFVNDYNTSAATITAGNPSIKATSAKIKDESHIDLYFQYDIPYDESFKTAYSQIAPSLLANVFKTQPGLQKMLDEGVVFNVSMTARDNGILAQMTLDKAKVDEMVKKQNGESGPISITTGGQDDQLRGMLDILNKNLPIVDEKAGTKIVKIDVDAEKQLVYTVEVRNDIAASLKSDAAKALMRESMMRNPGLKTVFNGASRYGVTGIKYLYLDEKGGMINEIVITRSDLQ